VGFDDFRQGRRSRKANVEDFKSFYGSDPVVYAAIFEDLQTTTAPAAKVGPKQLDLHAFMMGIHFLTVCPVDNCKAGTFKGCSRTCREWCWRYCSKIQALKEVKVSAFAFTGFELLRSSLTFFLI